MSSMETPHEGGLEQRALELQGQGVEFVVGAFCDILGRSKAKMVPISHLASVVGGSERYTPRGLGALGVMTPDEDEVVALPDVNTLQICPWDTRIAWMAADMSFGGREPFAHCARSILKRQLKRAEELGFVFNLGVEMEIYAFREASLGRADGYLEPATRSGKLRPTPAYDVDTTLDALPFLEPMVRCMNQTGFGVFSFDQEGGDGQFEFDFAYAPALEMADRITFFRLMARQVAKQNGLLVSFMPKPYSASWGSGAHFNMSLADLDSGANRFRDNLDPRGKGWSKAAYHFTAGLLKYARPLAAITAPTVNSYKRLTPRLSDGTVSWAPIWAAYGDNNRSCMMRLPGNRPCIENRAVDTSANVYLAAAYQLAAGLEGLRHGLDPGEPTEELTYDWRSAKVERLPRNLLEAIECFEADPLAREVFPARFLSEYAAMKHNEWDAYHLQVTDWERDEYLLAL